MMRRLRPHLLRTLAPLLVVIAALASPACLSMEDDLLYSCAATEPRCASPFECRADLLCHPPDEPAADAGQIDAGRGDGGSVDAGNDAGSTDAGSTDAGKPDAGADAGVDAGPLDAGRPDSGIDAGRPDSGPPDSGVDAGAPDAGKPDAGVDAGVQDAGLDAGSDAGPQDAGGSDAGCILVQNNGCGPTAECCSGLSCVAGRCRVPGDTCATAKLISAGSYLMDASVQVGTYVGADNDVSSYGACGAAGPEVFYQFTGRGNVSITVTSDAGTGPVVALLTSCSAPPDTCGTGAPSHTLTRSNLAPAMYWIAVDSSFANASGFTLTVVGNELPLKRGDVCDDALSFTLPQDGGVFEIGNHSGTTVDAGDPRNPCDGGFKDLVYEFDISRTGTLDITAGLDGGNDFKLGIAEGPSCAEARPIRCVDQGVPGGQETFRGRVDAGHYFVFFTGKTPADFGRYGALIKLDP